MRRGSLKTGLARTRKTPRAPVERDSRWASSMRNPHRHSGFTILELILALLLVSIIATLAIPMYFKNDEVTLENAAVLLARDLRATQNRSAYMGRAARVEFLEDGDGYQVLDADGNLTRNPRTDQPFVRRYSSDGVFEGVRIVEIEVGDDLFLDYGSKGYATEEARLVLAFHGEVRVLLVERRSGRIRIMGSTSGWRDLGY